MSEYFETRSKKGRGMAQASIDLIQHMYVIASTCQPITGRGIGYKLFTAGHIESMSTNEMQRVYRLLKKAREDRTIPWNWIVDESRQLEISSRWLDPEDFMESVRDGYHKDMWQDQPHRVEVWSEKGTIRGVLQPVLDRYGVGFRVTHGFQSATAVHDVAHDRDGRKLYALYCGDHDPSGLYMSEHDLPERLREYGGDHITLVRIALKRKDLSDLPSFPASDKKKDPRYNWFVKNHGKHCWELDAMDPNDLRERVESSIMSLIEVEAWNRGATCAEAEQESLQAFFAGWKGAT